MTGIPHNSPPNFSQTAVERYPSLTVALGNHYPAMQSDSEQRPDGPPGSASPGPSRPEGTVQSFPCTHPGCSKSFNVRANMLRHKTNAHGAMRKSLNEASETYVVAFDSPVTAPPVRSDLTIPTEIIWDADGPFARRQTPEGEIELDKVNLEKAPITGRRRFMAASEAEEDFLRKVVMEETLEAYKDQILPYDHPLSQLVRRITRRIITASDLGHLKGESPTGANVSWAQDGTEIPQTETMHPEKEWTVLVVNDRTFVNAFAAPGLVCVSTGIMPVAKDEEGLAAIVGHEIGHVAMRHSAEHLSQMKLMLPVIGLMWIAGLGVISSSFLAEYLYSLPHSRALETEADIVGLQLMARACYNPGASPRVFEDLGKLEHGRPKFLSTHPPTPERIAKLKTLLSDAYSIYNSNPECARLEEMRSRGYIERKKLYLDA
ncbi:unnamed protein product [Mycena citricolor]|uniref:C2H2-type domain-containing protein n=1 Tax=Mycena citricolor TaxID=2018698 RepID=A0AAD2GR01_9AGAR|nr:unnamed protein product [Mycena citricolor]CAK5274494.1 unnamed protein product [Mycena citricolor]